MPSQTLGRDSKLEDALDKVELTLKIRGITLVCFLFTTAFFWISGFFSNSPYAWLSIISLAIWIVSSLIFRRIIKKKQNVVDVYDLYFKYSAFFELGCLTTIVFTNGGILWIGAIFYLFTIIYSNIVLPGAKGYLMSFVAFFWFGGSAFLQYLKIIPFFPFAGFKEELYLDFNYLVTTLTFIFITFFLTGFAANALTRLLQKKTEELEKARTQLEETKVVLEIRVRARTRELEEIANTLDEQVKKRTEELEDKMNDLKMFQTLSVDRELKMVELKKEIEKLKNTKTSTEA